MSTPHVPDEKTAEHFDKVKLRVLGEARYECGHPEAGSRDHACPSCGGTLRRCCLSLVGNFQHADDCPEVARRRGEGAA